MNFFKNMNSNLNKYSKTKYIAFIFFFLHNFCINDHLYLIDLKHSWLFLSLLFCFFRLWLLELQEIFLLLNCRRIRRFLLLFILSLSPTGISLKKERSNSNLTKEKEKESNFLISLSFFLFCRLLLLLCVPTFLLEFPWCKNLFVKLQEVFLLGGMLKFVTKPYFCSFLCYCCFSCANTLFSIRVSIDCIDYDYSLLEV